MADADVPSYKQTLNLPETEFPMKADLPRREPLMIQRWQTQKTYQSLLQKNVDKESFVMPDGPPYANGDIHIGHVLNKVLKDIVIKFQNMNGKRAPFIPGWDCHGLPIEQKVLSNLGSKARGKGDEEIRGECRKEALKWVQTQRGQFERLGVMADWDQPYLTLDKEYEAEEIREFSRIFQRGQIYRGTMPVYWCIPLQTALAEAEVEYADHKSPAIYVKFQVDPGQAAPLGKLDRPLSIVIWTTTPWTLPANVAIALHPEFDYEIYEHEGAYLLLAQKLRESVESDASIQLKSTGRIFKGKDLEGLEAQHPFMNRTSKVVLGEHVTLEAGTGCVHTAPGHGQDDYHVGLRYQLPILSPVNAAGEFTDEVPEWAGINVFKANPLVVEKLKSTGHLLGYREIQHSYPHCWRSKSPLIFRATPQWFLKMDDPKRSIRNEALESLSQIEFVPKWGESRLRSMVELRPDWTLSRQRLWGVPIPVFYCEKCETELITTDLMEKIASVMEKGNGIESYWQTEISHFTKGHQCKKCGAKEFVRGRDILDVWFDSGVCHAAVQRKKEGLGFPADLYLEGSDQHRGWFQTSLLSSIAAHGKAPFKCLVTHGFVLDGQGRKMSKSLGNVIDPLSVIKDSGAEILRLWCVFEDYRQDLNCGKDSFKQVIETYRRFRNTFRFLLGNLYDFDPQTDYQSFQTLSSLDRWTLVRLQKLVEKSEEAYSQYQFNRVYHLLSLFFTVDLSATYLDIIKDRLYTHRRDGARRRSAQTVLFELVSTLTPVMAPILSFLSEEVYGFLPGLKEESVFLASFPKPTREWIDEELLTEMDQLFELRAEVNKVLEGLRAEKIIGSGLEAFVKITANGKQFELLRKYEADLPELFIVSQVSIESGPIQIRAEKALGEKCQRCWNYSEKTGTDKSWPGICPRCIEALT